MPATSSRLSSRNRLVCGIESSFNNAMKWKPDSFTVVAGTENGHLLNWALEGPGRMKTTLLTENPGGNTKVQNISAIKLHDAVGSIDI